MKYLSQIILSLLIFAGTTLAGDVTVSLTGVNPLSVNIMGTSTNQEAGCISIYVYFCDDGITDLAIENVNADQLETTWGWGTFLRTHSIQTGTWTKGGHTFTKRLYYDNADIGDQNDYWTTGGINALVCTFTTVGSGHAFVEVNGNDGLSNYVGSAHNVSYGTQDQPLPVELSSFTAKGKGRTVVLNWVTASEINNLGFILERSVENSDWQPIASYRTHAGLTGQGTLSSSYYYSFTDQNVTAGTSYTYRISEVSTNGQVTELATTEVETEILPTSTQLFAAYPNPFNPQTTLKYHLAQEGHVTLAVYDVLGRQIKMLADQQQAAGEYSLQWDGTTDAGLAAPSGTYLVRMQAGAMTQVQKVLLMK